MVVYITIMSWENPLGSILINYLPKFGSAEHFANRMQPHYNSVSDKQGQIPQIYQFRLNSSDM